MDKSTVDGTQYKVTYVYGIPVLLENDKGEVFLNPIIDDHKIAGEKAGIGGWAIETCIVEATDLTEGLFDKISNTGKIIASKALRTMDPSKKALPTQKARAIDKSLARDMVRQINQHLKAAHKGINKIWGTFGAKRVNIKSRRKLEQVQSALSTAIQWFSKMEDKPKS